MTSNVIQMIRYSPQPQSMSLQPYQTDTQRLKMEVVPSRGSQLIVPWAIITTWCLGGIRRRRLREATALVRTRRGLVTICARSRRRVETGSRSVETAAVAGCSATARLVGRCAAAPGIPGRLL